MIIQDNGLDILYQPASKSSDIKNGTKYLLPYHLKGKRAGCTAGGSNMWSPFHNAINNGKNNNWPDGNAPASMGYLNREQIPFLHALADEFTIADMYFQSVAGSTDPNRVVWMSGTNKGAPNDHVVEDNARTVPYEWTTYPEVLTNASVTWQVYQDTDNFGDNSLAYFKYWQNIKKGPERQKGMGVLGLKTFYQQALDGTLPQFSIIVGPRELSEHPDNTPLAGSWLQQQVVNSVINGKGWKDTALFINYDEAGGYFDHVAPPMAPQDEWVKDKFTGNQTYIGFGPRVPMTVISPWTRGGHVYSEVADHTSTLMFMEEWVGKDSKGTYLAPANNISPFHRKTSSNLVSIFDFDNPDYSIPKFEPVDKPAQILGFWASTEMCEIKLDPKTKPPYGNQSYPVVEAGIRPIRGPIALGRKVAFQTDGTWISIKQGRIATEVADIQKKKATPGAIPKEGVFQLVPSKTGYQVQSVANPTQCITTNKKQVQIGKCNKHEWTFDSHMGHYHIRDVVSSKYLNINKNSFGLSDGHDSHFDVYSVTL
jgi:phospholipase C